MPSVDAETEHANPDDRLGQATANRPVAVVDIGSNSVRLVAYESQTRSLTPIFNEKVLCGLGRGVASTGLLADDAMAKALAALRNFRALCRNMRIDDVMVLATAATRAARNGESFLASARGAIGANVTLVDGAREAELSAFGVLSSFYRPDGIVGDLGGGSLELIDIRKAEVGAGLSLPIGGLTLTDLSEGSPKRAVRLARDALADCGALKHMRGRTFYAVGGTWRALAKLHMRQRNYPLNVMHGYVIPATEAGDFARLVERVNTDTLSSIAAVNSGRRPLLAYGAVVLDELIRQGRPKEIVISASGMREGLMFERLPASERDRDPLLAAAGDFNRLRSRSPQHAEDLCRWTDAFMQSTHFDESVEDKRLRHAACLLSDTAWRAHPDYRSAQALNMIANAAFIGVDHPGRGFLALSVACRHMGPDEEVNPQLRSVVSPRLLDRARILAASMRIAYVVSAAMEGVLPRTSLRCRKGKLVLTFGRSDADLASDKVASRVKQLGRLIGRESEVRVSGA